MTQLLRLVDSDSKSADIFRSLYAEKTLRLTFEILMKNNDRSTFENAEEAQQKSQLSQACLQMLLLSSKITTLRPYLRVDAVEAGFKSVIKSEERHQDHRYP